MVNFAAKGKPTAPFLLNKPLFKQLNNLKVHAGMGAITLISGINFILAKSVVPLYFGPYALVLVRVAISTLLFWLLHDSTVKTGLPPKHLWPLILGCAIFGNFLNHLFFFKGLTLTTPINAAVITTTTPIFVLVFSILLKKESLTPYKLLGIGAAGIGALMLVGVGNLHFDGSNFWGDVLCFMNCISYAINLILLKRLSGHMHPLAILKWVFIIGTLFLIPAGLPETLALDWPAIPGWAIWVLVYNTLLSVFAIHLIKVTTIKSVQPSLLSTYMYLQPVVTAIFSFFLGRNDLTWTKLVYALIIISGVALTSLGPKKKVAIDAEEMETS